MFRYLSHKSCTEGQQSSQFQTKSMSFSEGIIDRKKRNEDLLGTMFYTIVGLLQVSRKKKVVKGCPVQIYGQYPWWQRQIPPPDSRSTSSLCLTSFSI